MTRPGTESADLGFARRHRFILAVVFVWAAAVLALAFKRGYGLEHGLTEALIPLGFGIMAAWSWPDRWQRVGFATAGLGSAHAETVHVLEGHFAAHGSFFALALLLLLYLMPITNVFLSLGVAVLHGGIASVDRQAVYGHGWEPAQRFTLIACELAWLAMLAVALHTRRARHGRGPRIADVAA